MWAGMFHSGDIALQATCGECDTLPVHFAIAFDLQNGVYYIGGYFIMQEEIWIIESGIRRRGKKKICLICDKEFITRFNKVRFCSHECSSKASSKPKVRTNCAWCKSEIFKKEHQLANSKSGLYFCNRKCKENAQKLGGIKEIQPEHYGTGKIEYRELFNKEQLYCRRCNYKEFECSVQIHHIDKNHSNNELSNLIPLCANCHYGLHNNLWSIENLKLS